MMYLDHTLLTYYDLCTENLHLLVTIKMIKQTLRNLGLGLGLVSATIRVGMLFCVSVKFPISIQWRGAGGNLSSKCLNQLMCMFDVKQIDFIIYYKFYSFTFVKFPRPLPILHCSGFILNELHLSEIGRKYNYLVDIISNSFS